MVSMASTDCSSFGSKARVDISYLGQSEGRYVLRTTQAILTKSKKVLLVIDEKHITAALLHDQLTGNTGDGDAYQVATFVIRVYNEIYETLSNRLSNNLIRRLDCYPVLFQWLLGKDSTTRHREWRNRCAHNAGVPRPYRRNTEDELFNQGFDTVGFLNHIAVHFPPLIADLDDLVKLLERDVNSFPLLDETPPDGQHAVDEQQAKRLLEERHPVIVKFQRQQDKVLNQSRVLEQMKNRVESGELDIRQQRAAKIAKHLDSAYQEAQEHAWNIHRRKLARAAKIFEEQATEAIMPWSNIPADEATHAIGDWEQRDSDNEDWTFESVAFPISQDSDVFTTECPSDVQEAIFDSVLIPSRAVIVDTASMYLAIHTESPDRTPPSSPGSGTVPPESEHSDTARNQS